MTANLPSRLDVTVLDPFALPPDVHRAADDAMRSAARAIVAPPVWTARLATMLRGSGVRVISLVSFPDGTAKPTVKAIEATSTIKDGADEIEVVPHHAALIRRDLDAARGELLEINRAARMTRREVAIHVILRADGLAAATEAAAIEPMLETACRAARESGSDGIILLRAYPSPSPAPAPAPSPALAAAQIVRTLRRHGEGLLIKVALVDDAPSAADLLAAGADRIGTPAVSQIVGGSPNKG